MLRYVGCGPNLSQTLSPVLALKMSAILLLPQWTVEAPGMYRSAPTSSLDLFIPQCLIFPIWKMRIILSMLSPLQNCCENQNNICVWLRGREAKNYIKLFSSSLVLFFCPQRLYISAEWCQINRRNAVFYCNPMKGLLW